MTNKELIRRAARGRDIQLVGCLGFNRSAEKLEQMGDAVLPEIEAFLCDEFASLNTPADQLPGHPWVGLSAVMLAYFKLAPASRRVDAGQFLLSLHGWLREEALRVISAEWGSAQGPQRKVLPTALRAAVQRLEHAGSEEERDTAHRLLRWQKRLAQSRARAAATHR